MTTKYLLTFQNAPKSYPYWESLAYSEDHQKHTLSMNTELPLAF